MLIKYLDLKQNKFLQNIFLVIFFLINTNFFAQVIPTKLFEDISNYKIGDDRSKLMEISDIVFNSTNDSAKSILVEKEILNFLKSNISYDAKDFACRQLRVIGSEVSAIELRDFLLDDNTCDIARYALENIQIESIDKLLISALPQVSKKNKIGIINTLGMRKSEISVKVLAKIISVNDEELSITAVSALGNIANEECKFVLEKHFNIPNENLRNKIFSAYLNCIQKTSSNSYSDYLKLYNTNNLPTPIKQAALAGIINFYDNKVDVIQKRILSEPNDFRFIPISKIKELPKETDFSIFAKLLSKLESANQIQLLGSLECVGKSNVKPFVLEMLESKNELVRISAIKALKNIGDKNDIIALTKIAAATSGSEADYARLTIDLMKDSNVDDEIIKNINSVDDNVKLELIRAVGSRNIKSALKDIFELAKSENKNIRSEAFKTLGEIASEENLKDLLNVLVQQKEVSDKRKVEKTISNIISKTESKNNSANLLIDEYNKNINADSKISILRLLGFTDSDNAHLTLIEALKNENEQIKIAAIQGLSNWSTPKPMNDLLSAAENSSNENIKSAALKGYTNFIELNKNITPSEKIDLYKKSLKLSQTDNEKNIALDCIGHIDDFESLNIFKSYINQPELKQTIDDGINRVAWHLHKLNPEKVKEYILYFLDNVKDEKFQTKNSELINVIDRFIMERDGK
ncbi:MAG: HEAT repeat domain-containing protein [Ignavibacteriae bacterium]|nr:HEAT repeat domain-containing protein [Ignavibacteriota bacterium]